MIYEPVSAHPKMRSKLSVKRVSKGYKMLKGCDSVAWQQSLVVQPRLMKVPRTYLSDLRNLRMYNFRAFI
jgi:hypothetical protein